MKMTAVALLACTVICSAQAPSSPAPGPAPGDVRRGGVILRESGCLDCHAFQGAGKGIAPDLSRRAAETYTRTRLAALMWNHAPAMWGAMAGENRAVPQLNVQAVGDIFAQFYAARFFEPLGDAGRGKAVFQARRCSACHDRNAKKIGPPLSEWKEVSDPAVWIRQMWNHSGAMHAEATRRKIAWPNLTGQDISDLFVYFKSLPETRSPQAQFSIADPGLGRTLFDSKGCTKCHVVKGAESGKISIPINGRPADSLSSVAATMWNHAPVMNASARGDLPRFDGLEMNHVIAYLFWAGFFEDPGNPRSGQRVYEKKLCGDCHDHGEANAPDLAFIRSRPGGVSSITMTSALWLHGPKMLNALRQKGRDWPRFSDTEMADLIAYLNSK